ncbi:MAG: hypothetical protein QME40_05595, partial [bacterium]|nr:hypothetical protein [bacterium]
MKDKGLELQVSFLAPWKQKISLSFPPFCVDIFRKKERGKGMELDIKSNQALDRFLADFGDIFNDKREA